MHISEFDFSLPSELIAQYPMPERSQSRLLVVEPAALSDKQFTDVLEYLSPNDCLIFNNTRVMQARLYGEKSTGGKIECLVERLLDDETALCHIRASKAPKVGAVLHFGDAVAHMQARAGDLFELKLEGQDWLSLMDTVGEMPLPTYMDRAVETTDKDRYQTVYSKHLGAVAAPTAGLHFDDALMEAIHQKGVRTGFVTLHVGAGTFQPVRVDDIKTHTMHSEWLEVSDEVVNLIRETKAKGGRVIAVGTTSVRSLETAALNGELKPFTGDTDIFIYPGFDFKVIDGMITNFHLPKSTLIMLVSAFIGKKRILSAYQHAIDEAYRFFSYGDAMLLLPNKHCENP